MREKSNEKKEGKIEGQNGNGPGGKEPQEQGEPAEEGEGVEDEINPATGFSPAEAKRALERLSDEDMKVRPRVDSVPEARPLKDW